MECFETDFSGSDDMSVHYGRRQTLFMTVSNQTAFICRSNTQRHAWKAIHFYLIVLEKPDDADCRIVAFKDRI